MLDILEKLDTLVHSGNASGILIQILNSEVKASWPVQ